MKILRKLICGFAATVLVAFAMPISASHVQSDNKFFHAIFPDTVPTGTGVQIAVTIFNTSPPPGQSTMNSLQFIAPAGVTITAISPGTLEPVGGGTSVIVNNIPGIGRGGSRTFTLTLNVTATGCTPGNWDVHANTGNAFPKGTDFALNGQQQLDSLLGCTGILKCPSLPTTAPGIYNFSQGADGNTTTGLRWENKDASTCIPVPFNVAFSNVGKTVLVEWDENVQPFATLEITTTWPRELIDPVTSLPHRTKVAWELSPLTEIPAPACLSSNPPVPYGTLAAEIDDDPALETSIQITATSLPAVPFAIVVPSNQASTAPERMLVTALSGPVSGVFTATVQRGSGGTTISTHSLGAAVVSTPLPVIDVNAKVLDSSVPSLIPHPYAGKQAQACLIDEQFETQPFGTAGCPTQAAGVEPLSCVLVKSSLFLLGDPVITRSY